MRKLFLTSLLIFSLIGTCFAQTEYLYLAPWEWYKESPELAYWRCPGGNSIGLLDLRSIPQMSKMGGVPEGYGLFVYSSPQTIQDSIYLGNDVNKILSAQIKNDLQVALNLTLDKNTPLDILWELLTTHSDPTGLTFAKPLIPSANGLELYIGQNSRIEAFDINTHLHAPKVLAVLKESYRIIRASGGPYQKFLGALCQKYGTTNYRMFQSADLPDEPPIRPTTTLTESFNKADADTLGPTLTWTETNGDWDVVSNYASIETTYNTWVDARAESDVSSTDHESTANINGWVDNPGSASIEHGMGTACRFAAAARTFYHAAIVRMDVAKVRLYKTITGTKSQLGSVNVTYGAGTDVKVQASGTTIKSFYGVTQESSVTDTAISTGTRGGISGMRYSAGYNCRMDSWSMADLAVTAAPLSQVIYIE